MTIKHLYPTQRPSLDLNFASTKRLDPRVTFTRGSTATYVDANGVIQSAANNEARFDHDPVTGESLGLLVEESSINIAWLSNYLNSVPQPNSALAPDGTFTAWSYSGYGFVSNQFAMSYPNYWSLSIFVKPSADAVDVKMQVDSLIPNPVYFNFSTETFSPSSGWTFDRYPNGWYRLKFTKNQTSYIGGHLLRLGFRNSSQVNVLGYYWGIQVEQKAFSTSYIPTSGSAVTRAADVASITGNNFSSWYNQSEGTVFADKTFNINNGHTYYFADSSLVYNRLRLQAITHSGDNSSDGSFFGITVAGNKTALGLQTDNVSVNGGTPDTSFTMPSSLDRLFIGRHPTVSSYLNGHIKRFAYYPQRLPNATLQALTL